MIVERETKTHRSPVKSSIHRGRRGSALAWELRQTFTWTWFLPLLVIGGSLLFSWLDYQANLRAPAPPLNGAAHRITVVLDYIHPLRDTLELLLPILSVFLATDLLIKEWRRRTLMLLATRKSLLWFLAVRFHYLLGYLLLLCVGAILLSWWLTPYPQPDLSMGMWLWQTLLTVMAPTLFLMALGLLMAHLSVNTIAGYVLPACCWLANWLYALQLEQAHEKNPILSYLLFGWSDKDLTPQPDAWLPGKILLSILAAFLMAVQPWLLQRGSLQHKETE